MNKIVTFIKNNTYNLRSGKHISRVNVDSTPYGMESIGNLGAKVWNLVPVHMKDLKALSTFKNQIKKFLYLFSYYLFIYFLIKSIITKTAKKIKKILYVCLCVCAVYLRSHCVYHLYFFV